VRYPTLYDENDCLILPDIEGGGSECDQVIVAPGEVDPPNRDAWKDLLGFQGNFFADEVTGEGVVLLPGSVSSPQAESWRATGLVRNETTVAKPPVSVSTLLYDASGSLLDAPRAATGIGAVRPGEPAPFMVTSDIAANRVRSWDWCVTVGDVAFRPEALFSRTVGTTWTGAGVVDTPNPGSQVKVRARLRDAAGSLIGSTEVTINSSALPGSQATPFSLVFPVNEPVEQVEWSAERIGTTSSQRPELQLSPNDGSSRAGTVEYWGTQTVEEPTVIAAWLDGDRVISVDSTPVVPLSGLTTLGPGRQTLGDFAFAEGEALELADSDVILWAVGD
jgi:hypothetical protein